MKKVSITFLMCLVYSYGLTTNKNTSYKPFSIQYIRIMDNSLVHYLENYIKNVESENDLFRKGLGFIVLENIDYSINSGRPLNEFNLDSSVDLKNRSGISIDVQVYPLFTEQKIDCIKCNYFPPYYTIIDKKIVLIYESNFLALNGMKYQNDTHNANIYNKKSMKKLSKLINNMAIIDLPKNYVFEDFIEKDMKLSILKDRAKSKYDILKFYEFIDFKASEKIVFDKEENKWKKI